jgi:hypothetical protein
MEQHRWDDDDRLLEDLAEALRDVAPLSRTIAEHARGALAWRTVDCDLLLASLSSDSSLERSGRSRGSDGGSRVVVFTAAPLSVELEMMSDHVAGQIVPPGAGEVVVESADGATTRIEADEYGFFIISSLPDEPVRLRCETPNARLVTDWVRL